jgi:hypothetical protein
MFSWIYEVLGTARQVTHNLRHHDRCGVRLAVLVKKPPYVGGCM